MPRWFVLLGLLVSAAVWARTPDHAIGVASVGLVGGWWAARDVLDWRVLLVAVLLVAARLAATVAPYGPATLAVDPRLTRSEAR